MSDIRCRQIITSIGGPGIRGLSSEEVRAMHTGTVAIRKQFNDMVASGTERLLDAYAENHPGEPCVLKASWDDDLMVLTVSLSRPE